MLQIKCELSIEPHLIILHTLVIISNHMNKLDAQCNPNVHKIKWILSKLQTRSET